MLAYIFSVKNKDKNFQRVHNKKCLTPKQDVGKLLLFTFFLISTVNLHSLSFVTKTSSKLTFLNCLYFKYLAFLFFEQLKWLNYCDIIIFYVFNETFGSGVLGMFQILSMISFLLIITPLKRYSKLLTS